MSLQLYTKEKGRLSKYQMVCDYDGSTEEDRIYKIEFSSELISESCGKLLHAMANPDMKGRNPKFCSKESSEDFGCAILKMAIEICEENI